MEILHLVKHGCGCRVYWKEEERLGVNYCQNHLYYPDETDGLIDKGCGCRELWNGEALVMSWGCETHQSPYKYEPPRQIVSLGDTCNACLGITHPQLLPGDKTVLACRFECTRVEPWGHDLN